MRVYFGTDGSIVAHDESGRRVSELEHNWISEWVKIMMIRGHNVIGWQLDIAYGKAYKVCEQKDGIPGYYLEEIL